MFNSFGRVSRNWTVKISRTKLRMAGNADYVEFNMTLAAALENYEVIGASSEEGRILARWGHPFRGVQ
jgi:hypothetical protein